MGNKIAPRFQSGDKHRKMFRDMLLEKLSEEYIADDGTIRTLMAASVDRLVNTAAFAESDKDATSAMKVILDRLEGRPAVVDTSEKVEMPAVKFILREEELGLIESKSRQTAGSEEAEPGRIVVSIDGMDGVMEF